MKKIIFLGLVALGLLAVPAVKAGWGRLVDLNECISVDKDDRGGDEVCIVYDRQAKVNCYYTRIVGSYGSGGGIYCMKAE